MGNAMLDEKTLSQFTILLNNVEDSESLIQIKSLIDLKLEDVKDAEIAQFVAKAQELQRNYGIEPTDLATALSSNRGKGLRVKDKYRSKTNPNDGWSGRGKQPQWIKDYLQASPNNKIEDLLVDQKSKPQPKPETNSEPKVENKPQQSGQIKK